MIIRIKKIFVFKKSHNHPWYKLIKLYMVAWARLNSAVFPLRSESFNFKSIDTPLSFSDLNSYSTEISSQNKF